MTQISRDTVLHLAALSSLSLNDDEVNSLQADLGNIIKYFDQLEELDTTDVVPTYQVTDLENVYRDDVVVHSDVTRETLLMLAPESQDQQIKVPKVL